ncbi:GDSL-type esterase/lipase family protein [Streptomyces sp. NPDC005865]|uniref:SGNH/GDSL hydrolase family protein n=1 Tax=Streptomyces sp. NPDC005865 TaxID=3155453 RepID=UPI0034009B60
MAVLPRAPARGRKCEYFRGVNRSRSAPTSGPVDIHVTNTQARRTAPFPSRPPGPAPTSRSGAFRFPRRPSHPPHRMGLSRADRGHSSIRSRLHRPTAKTRPARPHQPQHRAPRPGRLRHAVEQERRTRCGSCRRRRGRSALLSRRPSAGEVAADGQGHCRIAPPDRLSKVPSVPLCRSLCMTVPGTTSTLSMAPAGPSAPPHADASSPYRGHSRTRPGSLRPFMRTAVGVWLTACALLAAPTTVRADAPQPIRHYVALGDSTAAGTGVPPLVDLGCLRSGNNYPHLVARSLQPAHFTDATCVSGRRSSLDSQLAALRPTTDLVTLTLGANDAHFFLPALTCGVVGILVKRGSPCRAVNSLLSAEPRPAKARPAVESAVDAIRRRAPQARIIVVGYLRVLPDDPTVCGGRSPYPLGDAVRFARLESLLNQSLHHAALSRHTGFADLAPSSLRHTACAPRTQRWTEPLVPNSPTVPFHPNLAGQRAIARQVTSELSEE